MYTIVLDEDSIEDHSIMGCVVGRNYSFSSMISQEDLFYDEVVIIENSNMVYPVKVCNCDEFVDSLRDGSIVSDEDLNIDILEKILADVVSYFEGVYVTDKEDYCIIDDHSNSIVLFNNIGIPVDLLDCDFDLSNFFIKEEKFNFCGYCGSSSKTHYRCGDGILCGSCFDRVNFECARLGGNEELKKKLMCKMVSEGLAE
jgi:hypothetical protein